MSEKDVEKGYGSEEENSTPFLPSNTDKTRPSSYGGRQRPPRPRKPTTGKGENFKPKTPVLEKLNLEPAELSTADSTPALETSDLHKKFIRGDRRLRRLNTELLNAICDHDMEEVERLLKSGANPNATCRLDFVSAIHLAAVFGGDSLDLLLKFGAERNRQDRLGRTPLHLAAYAGNARQMAILLDLPEGQSI